MKRRNGETAKRRGLDMKRTMTMTVSAVMLAALILIASSAGLHAEESAAGPVVRIHYLGHAAFYLRFANGTTVLTDYGKSRAYGLDSPIYGIGMRTPDVATISHRHEDHFGGPLGKGVPFILWGNKSLSLNGLDITPIPTYEQSLARPDNASHLFVLAGRKVLHLADCQALITACDQPEVQAKIRQLYPDVYDIVMLPIGFTSDILEPAARFLEFLQARAVIPMHYWSPADKPAFLERLKNRRRSDGKPYVIRAIDGAQWSPEATDLTDGAVLVVGLTPGSFDGWK
jgi:L-ascorbate metabolism protein UlaG (beta-lactamase superfamily)